MAIIKKILKKGGVGAGGSCKWCAQGECWSHGQKGKGKGASGGKGKGFQTPGPIATLVAQMMGGGMGGGAGVVTCHTCGKAGHKSFECFSGAKGGGKFGAGIVCHNCGKPGHKSPDCFQGQNGGGNFGAGIVCHNCGKTGHKSPDCFHNQKGWGKGGNKGGGKGPKGGDLLNFKTELKVWIGGLAANSTSKENNLALKEYMGKAGNCRYAEIGKSGAGGAAFATAEEATNAIATLNGTRFAGAKIEVDVWNKKEKK